MVNDIRVESSSNPPHSDPADHPTRPWYRRTWVIVVAVLVIVAFLVHHFSKEQPKAAGGRGQSGNAAINVAQSRTGDMGIYINALGTVTPTYTVSVYSQVTGRVVDVHYREGQMVTKGQPLIDIDARPYEATLKQAEGTLTHDKALLAQARMDLERYQSAFNRNAIAKQQLEDQAQTVAQYQGTVQADEGSVAYDKVQLEYCHIVSPVAGRVGLRLVDPGNTIFSGSSSVLVVITQLQPITVVFSVSEDDIPRVQEQLKGDNKLSVGVFDRANAKLIESGTLTSLDNQVDTTTGTLRFRAEFENQDMGLFPNQFVNARLLVQMLKGVTVVPTVTIQHNGANDFVYVLKQDKTVAVQNVTALAADDKDTAVKGLNTGVTIAASGFDRLENGAHVTVRSAGQNGGASGQNGTKQSSAGQSGADQSGTDANSSSASGADQGSGQHGNRKHKSSGQAPAADSGAQSSTGDSTQK